MKVGEQVIGKRVSVGGAIMGIATALAQVYPQHAPTIIAIATPTIFVVQLLIARFGGITK